MLKDIVKRIHMRLEALGMKAATASRMAGLSSSAIRNLERAVDAGKEAGPSLKTLAKLAPVLETSVAWLSEGEGPEIVVGLSDSVADLHPAPIPVTGYVEAGNWFDVENDRTVQDEYYVPAHHDFPPACQRAFVVSGNSINRIARPGAILVTVNIIGAGISLKDGDLVVVERSRYDGQMVERTAKRLRRTASGWELWPESDDPNFQRPIVVNGSMEHENYDIKYKVLLIVSRP